MPGTLRNLILLLLTAACFAQPRLAQPGRDYSLPAVYSSAGEIASKVLPLKDLKAGENYSFLLSLNSPGGMGAGRAGGRRSDGRRPRAADG